MSNIQRLGRCQISSSDCSGTKRRKVAECHILVYIAMVISLHGIETITYSKKKLANSAINRLKFILQSINLSTARKSTAGFQCANTKMSALIGKYQCRRTLAKVYLQTTCGLRVLSETHFIGMIPRSHKMTQILRNK